MTSLTTPHSAEDGRPTIVYIEDDPQCADVVRDALRKQCEVLCAADGPRGLDLVTAVRPALVLVDLHLPTLTGFQVIEHLRANPETAAVPVVAISARVMHHERDRALGLGCRDFVAKPFELDRLRRVIETALKTTG